MASERKVAELEEMLNQILKDEHYGLSDYAKFRERRKEFIRALLDAARDGYSRPSVRGFGFGD